MDAKDMASFRAHMALAREYEWRAATEPYDQPLEGNPDPYGKRETERG